MEAWKEDTLTEQFEALLKEARVRATEAGLHGLGDSFEQKVSPALSLLAARRSGEDGATLPMLEARLEKLEAAQRVLRDRMERSSGSDEQIPGSSTGFRWRPELSVLVAFCLAGLCMEIWSPVRVDVHRWAALLMLGVLVTLNLRTVPRLIQRVCSRIGQSRRSVAAQRAARALEKEIDGMRIRIVQEADRSSGMERWVARHLPVVIAEYQLYRERAAMAARCEV